jgi:hypothetical protein
MAQLTDLGFAKGVIFETILSTYNGNGAPNAAPMGVTMQDPQNLTFNLFNSSATSHNLKANKCGVINLTSNIEIFYKTAFKEANPNGKLPPEWFEKAQTVNAPKLCLADATVEVSVAGMEPIGEEKTKVFLNVERINVVQSYPKVYNRAMALTLEAIIHATRVKAFANIAQEKERVGKLLEMIKNSDEIVNRVAPNSAYSMVMADLMKRIDSWRNRQ